MSQKILQPRWLSYQGASDYCSLSARDIQELVKLKLVRSKNVLKPGATRGRRVIDRLSLDEFIESQSDDISPPVRKRRGREILTESDPKIIHPP
jgi:hypothetical protein